MYTRIISIILHHEFSTIIPVLGAQYAENDIQLYELGPFVLLTDVYNISLTNSHQK